MFAVALQVTCFLPNATFTYNPLSYAGVLSATFIAYDDTDTSKICRGLDGHLARGSVEFAVAYITSGSYYEDIRYKAVSDNFYFSFGADISLTLTAESYEAHEQALVTYQANFQLEILDMDAVIEQTLSVYAVQSFNLDECFSDLQLFAASTLTVEASFRNCDLSGSMYQNAAASTNIHDDYVIASIQVTGVGEMVAPVGTAVWYAQSGITDKFRYSFDCDSLALYNSSNGARCREIIKYLSEYCGYVGVFKLRYKLSARNLNYELHSYISLLYNQRVHGCVTSSYSLSYDTLSVHFAISNDTRCVMPAEYEMYYQGNLQETSEITYLTGYFFNQTIELLPKQNTITMYCSLYENADSCLSYLQRYAKSDSLNLRFRLYYKYPDGTFEFYSMTAERADYCFYSVRAYFFVDSYADDAGGVRLELEWTGSQLCRRQIAIRSQLSYRFQQRISASGRLDQLEDESLLELDMREIFSNTNKSITFVCDNCKKQLKRAGTAIAQQKDASFLVIDNQDILVSASYNYMYDSNPNIFLGLGIALGAAFGIAGFLVNWNAMCRISLRSRKTVIAAID